MHLPINLAFSMVYDLVRESAMAEHIVGCEIVGVDSGLGFDVSANFLFYDVTAASGDYAGADFSAALKNAEYCGFILHPTLSDKEPTTFCVHESRFTTDECLIYFDFLSAPTASYGSLFMQCEPDAVHHEPSRLLSDAKSTRDFIRTDSVLGVHDEPHGYHPLVHAERRVLKDSSDLDGELLLTVLAEPDAPRRDKRALNRIAAWASNLAIRPAQLYGIVKRALRVGEIRDCFLQRLGKPECVCHV